MSENQNAGKERDKGENPIKCDIELFVIMENQVSILPETSLEITQSAAKYTTQNFPLNSESLGQMSRLSSLVKA